jgi:hypothetical protein
VSRFGFLDVLALLIPATSFIEVKIVGRLFAPDMLLAVIIPFLILSRKEREFTHRLPRTFLLLAGLWLFGQVATDLVRQTPFQDWARGWAKITFTMINFASLCMLLERRPRRIVLYAAGLALGGTLTYFLNPSIYAASQPWKFGYGVGVTWVLVLLATALYRRSLAKRSLAIIVLAGSGFLNILMGFRSLGGILFLTVSFLAARSKSDHRKAKPQRIGMQRVALLLTIIFISCWGILELYGALAESGLLGYQSTKKFETQKMGAYGVLIGGRSEVLSATIAIKDSPLLGHGDDDCLIPTHSIILGAWVEAGVLGAIVWLWVGVITLKTLLAVFQKNSKLAPLVTFFGFLLLWDLAFSPYGATRRFTTTFFVVVLFTALAWIQEEMPLPGRQDTAVLNHY